MTGAEGQVPVMTGGPAVAPASVSDVSVRVLRSRVQIPRHVVYRPFPAETVVLNLDAGQYHGLNPVAGRMLALMESTATVADAAEAVAKEFNIGLERVQIDICRLCQQLESRGLIALVAAEA